MRNHINNLHAENARGTRASLLTRDFTTPTTLLSSGQHVKDGTTNFSSSKKCTLECRGRVLLFGIEGKKTRDCCAQLAPVGTVNVKGRECRTQGCCKLPTLGVAGTRMAEYCAQYAPERIVNICSKK